MKNIVWSLLFFICWTSLFSQDSTFLTFGTELSPKLVTNVFDSDDLTKPAFPLSVAITGNVYFNFNSKYQIKTGLGTHLLRIGIKDYSLLSGCDFDGFGGVDQYNSWLQNDYTIIYLGIPTEINYFLSDRKSRPYINFGGTFLINLRESGTINVHECDGESIVEIAAPLYEAAEFLVLVKAGLGYEFSLNQNQSFFIEPSIEYSLNPFLKSDLSFNIGNSNFDKSLLNFALNTGVKF